VIQRRGTVNELNAKRTVFLGIVNLAEIGEVNSPERSKDRKDILFLQASGKKMALSLFLR
jgi:hypothetical protein